MALFGFGKKKIVGIDIGSSSVKIVELKGSSKGYQLVNFGTAPLPSEAIVDGALMNSTAVVEAIGTLTDSMKLKGKEVSSSVSGHSVIIKKISLPTMTEDELAESIQWEAEQYIPFDISEVNIDFQILDEASEEEGQMSVLLVAAKKDLVNDYVGVVAEAGFSAAVIDIDAFALQNAFEVNYPLNPGEMAAMVNIGASNININVIKDGSPAFTRDISAGGNQYSEEIQKSLNVSYEEAEIMKKGRRPGEEGDEVIPQGVASIIQTVSESLASEIQRSLDFFAATSSEDRISKIYLSGGSSVISGLQRIIEDRTGYPVELFNPFNNIQINEKSFDPNFIMANAPMAGVAVGLALRSAGD